MKLARSLAPLALLGSFAWLGCADRAQHATSLYAAGDYAGAARAADDGLAQHPDDDDLWGMRIRAALALGDADGVAKSYETYASHRGSIDKALLRDLSIATLGQALASPSARLKIIAIETVEELELNALADRVAERMGDDDDRVAASASTAVIHGYPQAPGVADSMLRSENADARRIAINGVGKKIGKLAVADLEAAAGDGDPRVRAAALHWLGVIKDADAVELCTKRLHDHDESVRAAAAAALAQIGLGNLGAIAKLAFKDHARSVRLAGIELLVAAHRDDELAAVAAAPDPIVAIQAAIAIHRQDLARAAIERGVVSDVAEIRGGVASLLAQAVGNDGAPFARSLAVDPSFEVRLAAGRALARMGARDTARGVFSDALRVDGADTLAAATDLADLGDPEGVHALDALVRDRTHSPEQRAAAATAHRTAHRVTPGLVAALADPDGLVRAEAAAALGALAR